MSRNYQLPKQVASFISVGDEGAGHPVSLAGANVLLPISMNSKYPWKGYLKATIMALGKHSDTTVTFLIADTLNRHTLKIQYAKYINQLLTSDFSDEVIKQHVMNDMSLRPLARLLLSNDDLTIREALFNAQIDQAIAAQAIQTGLGWKKKLEQTIHYLTDTAEKFHMQPLINYRHVFYESSNGAAVACQSGEIRALHWAALQEKSPEYERYRAEIQRQYEENHDFKAVIDTAKTAFIEKTFSTDDDSMMDVDVDALMHKMQEHSLEYLLEEAAVTLALMRSGQYSHLAYPYENTNKPLFDLLISLAGTASSEAVSPSLVTPAMAVAAPVYPVITPIGIMFEKMKPCAAVLLYHGVSSREGLMTVLRSLRADEIALRESGMQIITSADLDPHKKLGLMMDLFKSPPLSRRRKVPPLAMPRALKKEETPSLTAQNLDLLNGEFRCPEDSGAETASRSTSSPEAALSPPNSPLPFSSHGYASPDSVDTVVAVEDFSLNSGGSMLPNPLATIAAGFSPDDEGLSKSPPRASKFTRVKQRGRRSAPLFLFREDSGQQANISSPTVPDDQEPRRFASPISPTTELC